MSQRQITFDRLAVTSSRTVIDPMQPVGHRAFERRLPRYIGPLCLAPPRFLSTSRTGCITTNALFGARRSRLDWKRTLNDAPPGSGQFSGAKYQCLIIDTPRAGPIHPHMMRPTEQLRRKTTSGKAARKLRCSLSIRLPSLRKARRPQLSSTRQPNQKRCPLVPDALTPHRHERMDSTGRYRNQQACKVRTAPLHVWLRRGRASSRRWGRRTQRYVLP